LSKEIFKEPLGNNHFFSNNFRKKYLHKREFINDANSVVSLEILDDMLSKSNIWNNKNFKMMLDQKTLNFNDFSSLSIDITGSNNRPDVDKVQKLVSKGASIILNDIEKYNTNLLKISDELQRLTQGRCQGNLYFSMASHKAFGPHFDLHDVFAFHFEGEKVWNIYENIEDSPINHHFFHISSEERIKRAGKLVEQVTLKPGDLLYIPRGQYHDALASKNGAIHVAFGLTYFKPIDLMSSLWEKFILNDFMRQDIQLNPNKNDLKEILDKFSKEIVDTITSEDTLEILNTNINNWPYKIKEYSIKSLVLEGIRYDVDKSVRFEKKDDKSFLISGKNSVEVPKQYCDLTQYILDREFVTDRLILTEFKNTSKEIITECIENLTNMKVLK
tara:strand:- start:93 stop:1256 length:1164 start_codon:yes stop_codon:yes gene_type:complete